VWERQGEASRQGGRGTEAQRDRGTEAQRHRGREGEAQRHRGREGVGRGGGGRGDIGMEGRRGLDPWTIPKPQRARFPPKRRAGMAGKGRAAPRTWGARALYDGGGGTPWRALEKAASAINLAIAKLPRGETQVDRNGTNQRKRARANARGNAKRELVDWKATGSPQEYLALPVDAYATLDERWIQREEVDESETEEGDDGTAVFVLQVPMDLLAGISLRPRIWIVSQRKENTVQLSSARAEVGDARLDACFDLSLEADIQWCEAQSNRRRGFGNPSPTRDHGETQHKGALEVQARVAVGFDVPQALSFMPRVALGSAGSVVMRAVLKAMLPRFLDLLVADYKSWAEGSTTRMDAKGDLIPLDAQSTIAKVEEGNRMHQGGTPGTVQGVQIVGK